MSYNKKYYQTWYKKHQKERILAVRAYREKNSIWWNKYRQKYYLKNKKLIALRKRRYGMTAQGIYMYLKRESVKKNRKFNISKSEFILWYNNQPKQCEYCKRQLKDIISSSSKFDKKYKRLTIDRVNSKKGYSLDNIKLACFRCNYIKSNYFNEKEMLEIGKIIYNKEN